MCIFLRFLVFEFYFFCVHFLHFLLQPSVEVDISDIAEIISGITNMVKAIILVVNNTPQKTYRIVQYTDSWNRFHSLLSRLAVPKKVSSFMELFYVFTFGIFV